MWEDFHLPAQSRAKTDVPLIFRSAVAILSSNWHAKFNYGFKLAKLQRPERFFKIQDFTKEQKKTLLILKGRCVYLLHFVLGEPFKRLCISHLLLNFVRRTLVM